MSPQPSQISTSLPVSVPVSNEDPDSSELALPVVNSPSLPGIQPKSQALPRRDPECENCIAPMTQRHHFDQALKPGRYAYGEIVNIKESVHTPLGHVLYQRLMAMAATSGGSLSRPGGKWRPGVVLDIPGNPRAKGPNPTKIMLMATFGGRHKFEDLPVVVRHFSVPVSPHYEISVDVEHLHTTPEWQREHAWLILPPCISSGTVLERWGWQDEHGKFQEECSFKLDPTVLSQLTDIYKRRFEEWNTKCRADEGYMEECIKEYRVWKGRDNNSNNSASSIGGSPLIPQATRELPVASDGTSGLDARHRGSGHEVPNVPGAGVLSSQPLSGDTHAHVASEPSHSRHASAGDAPLLDLESANLLGVSLGSKVESWLSALPPSLSGVASTESFHDNTVSEDTSQTTLQDATVTSPQQGTSTGVNVNSESPVTTDNHQASHGDLPASTSASAAAPPTLESGDLKGLESYTKPKKAKSKRFRGKRTKPQ